MRTSILFLLTFLISTTCLSQDCFRWLGDAEDGTLYNVKSPLKIRLKVLGVPSDAKFDVLIDGKSIYKNQKSNAAPIITQNDELLASVPVKREGVMGIQVVMTSSGKNCSSSTLIIKNGIPPKLYLLSIGPTPPNIKYTDNDATDVYRAFVKQACGEDKLYSDVIIRKIVAESAGYTDIRREINSMIKDNDISPADVFILFISSHGNIRDGEFYIQPTDFEGADPKGTSVKFKDLTDSLDNIPAKKLIFIDACESGGAKSGGGNKPSINDHINTILATKRGYTIITSSSGKEQSYYDKTWENGAFTESLIEGLSGKANYNEDEVITTGEIYRYLEQRVPELCMEIGAVQHPDTSRNDLGDFPFFKIDQFCTSNIKGKTNYYPTIYVNGKDYLFGSPKSEKGRQDDEEIQRKKSIGDFNMGEYEVSNKQYCDFLNDIRVGNKTIEKWVSVGRDSDIIQHKGKFQPRTGKEHKPVIMVSYHGAVKYAKWLTRKDCEYAYKLPKEEQWECAARDREGAYASDYDKYDNLVVDVRDTPSNKKGIHGMSSNVAEWCLDNYPNLKGTKSIRGRAVDSNNKERRIAARHKLKPDVKHKYVGFRLVRMDKRALDKCK